MTPMEAWRIISANMLELYKRRKTACYKGYTDADIEAEVIVFKALREAEKGIVRCDSSKSKIAKAILDELESKLKDVQCFDHAFYTYLRLIIEELKSKYMEETSKK